MLKALPKDQLEVVRAAVWTQKWKEARIFSVQLMNQLVDTYLKSDPAYPKYKALIIGSSEALNYDLSDDWSKLSIGEKEMRQIAYAKSIYEKLKQLDPMAMKTFAVRKTARDYSSDDAFKAFLKFDETKNEYFATKGLILELQKSERAEEAIKNKDIWLFLAVYSPLIDTREHWDTTEYAAYLWGITSVLQHLSYVPELTDEQAVKFQTELAIQHLPKIETALAETTSSVNDENRKWLTELLSHAFASLYDTEVWLASAIAWQDITGGTPALKKLAKIKYDLSKVIDKYRNFAITSRGDMMSNPWRLQRNPISPIVMDLIKLQNPPAINAPAEWLTLTPLPKPGKDINRTIKPRKKVAFKIKAK